MVNAQEWLNQTYPDKQQTKIIKISNEAEGELLISDFPELEEIKKASEGEKDVTVLKITNCPKLWRVNCYFCRRVKELIINDCPQLKELNCDTNQINNLNLNEFSNLTHLNCSNNQITELDVSNNQQLVQLSCENNRLKKLNLSNNPKLTILESNGNAFIRAPCYFTNKKKIINAQRWFDDKYQGKKEVTAFLNITTKNVMGGGVRQRPKELLIADFPNLEEAIINHQNNISKIIVRNCPRLSSLNFLYNSSLTAVDISDLDTLNSFSIDERLRRAASWPIKKEKQKFESELAERDEQIEAIERQLQIKREVEVQTNRKIRKLETDLETAKSDLENAEISIEEKQQLINSLENDKVKLNSQKTNLEGELKQEKERFGNEKGRLLQELNQVREAIPNETEKKLIQFAEWSSWEEDKEDFQQIQSFLQELETGEGKNILINPQKTFNWTQLRGDYEKLRIALIDLVKTTKRKIELEGDLAKANENFREIAIILEEVESNFENLKQKVSIGQKELQRAQKEKERLQAEEREAQKWFKIEEVEAYPDYIRLELDKSIKFRWSNQESRIYLTNRFPFNQYRVGDELEIGLEELASKSSSENLDSVLVVKKAQRNKRFLHDWWQEGNITYQERKKLLEIGEIDHSPTFALKELKKLFYYQELVENNREKLDIEGKIQNIILFSTWFNSNCIFIVNGESEYNTTLVIYKFPRQNKPEILEVIKFPKSYSEESKVKNKFRKIEAKLNGGNPILCCGSLQLSYEDGYLLPSVKKIDVAVTSDVVNNPDKYFEPLDIIKNFEGDKLSHCRIYLGNKKICYAFVGNCIDEWQVQPDQFITRYHLSIPAKHSRQIIAHIAKAFVDGGKDYYGIRGKYNRQTNNCEHFVNLCVLGLDLSEHVEMKRVKTECSEARKEIKIDNLKEKLEENDKFFNNLISENKKTEFEKQFKKIIKLTKKKNLGEELKEKETKLETYIEIKPKESYFITKKN